MKKKTANTTALETAQTIMPASDRALAYVRDLELPPEQGLELVLECLRDPGRGAGITEVMSRLHRLLAERGLNPEKIFHDVPGRNPLPPMERSCMISEGLDISILNMAGRIITGGFRPLKKLVFKKDESLKQ